ncbi:MAG TPA: diaminopimelate epimerase [Terriglobales bacterium]|nr:diaminopimelate epimerase [Terriglobales bacterium]
MQPLPFTKASACGNDFIVAPAPERADLQTLSRALCDRHNGIGADGVEWLVPNSAAALRVRLVNADGSEAEMSGNGTRCVAAAHCAEHDKPPGAIIDIQTAAGLKRCALQARTGLKFDFEMQMGEPQPGDPFSIKLAFGEITGMPVSMGNPHFVIFVDEFLPGWQAEGAEIGKHHDFQHGTNVEFVKVLGPGEVELRIFERGVGETQSSGTGSCAAAVAAIHSGRAQSPLLVRAPGGAQIVRWEQNDVWLTGPARIICKGEFFAEML